MDSFAYQVEYGFEVPYKKLKVGEEYRIPLDEAFHDKVSLDFLRHGSLRSLRNQISKHCVKETKKITVKIPKPPRYIEIKRIY